MCQAGFPYAYFPVRYSITAPSMARFSWAFMLDGESLKTWLAQILGDYPSTLCSRQFLPGACHVVLIMCEPALLL